ncbi:hypothetical protein [Leptothoe sp. PORK10 BA2]|uniref:hypothetical protein n=1 Tax=Leptothoe sp. PORK10 BA2 TaxID=3110254 RepID=UPI002B1F45AA|nr:hypothetical protein [Leptothoe sp. PORK10 BA2]MEA5466402.1 hypothetical protein [Leptothoe sp. PORK10 BA2]
MVNASGHIEQQLSKLKTQTADIATELETLVDHYLQVLSQASKRQLVLAAYHVCTQIYPDRFLALSLSQRDKLQQRLRDLGNRIQSQLNDQWATAKHLSLKPAEEDGLAVIRQLFLEAASVRAQSSTQPEPAVTHAQDIAPSSTSDHADMEAAPEQPDPRPGESPMEQRSQENLFAEIQTLMGREHLDKAESDDEIIGPMQPAQVMRRQILIEKAIRDVLKAVSEKANDILQKADVMPEVPKMLLSAASGAERLGHMPMKTPNLVRLAIKVIHEPEKDGFDDNDEQPDAEDETQSGEWPDEAEVAAAIIAREGAFDEKEEDDDEDAKESDNFPLGSMPRFLQLESLPDFVMIQLRLSEIEFAEANVAVWRSRIRKKMGHLKQVGYAYKDAERQLEITQAEDAWRASWTND